jgi:hypothetical protein
MGAIMPAVPMNADTGMVVICGWCVPTNILAPRGGAGPYQRVKSFLKCERSLNGK